MTWENRYTEQAESARVSALHYARLGEETTAEFWRKVAETYEELAKETQNGNGKD